MESLNEELASPRVLGSQAYSQASTLHDVTGVAVTAYLGKIEEPQSAF